MEQTCDFKKGLINRKRSAAGCHYDVDIYFALAGALRANGNLSLRCSGEYTGGQILTLNGNMTEADFSDGRLGPNGMNLIAGSFASLVTLLLPHNYLQAKGAASLAQVLQANSEITSLDISSNELAGRDSYDPDFSGITTLLKAMKEHTPQLKNLNMCNNDFRNFGDDQQYADMSQKVADAAMEHPTLETFCHIPLAELRQDCVATLDLSGHEIGLHGVMVLSTMCCSLKTLSDLDISYNRLCRVGAARMADLLTQNQVLQSIHFGKTRRVTLRRSMTTANLTSQRLGLPGILIACAFLPRCRALTSVDMSNNIDSFSEEGPGIGRAIADMLGKCPDTLTKVNISGNLLKGTDPVNENCSGTDALTAALSGCSQPQLIM